MNRMSNPTDHRIHPDRHFRRRPGRASPIGVIGDAMRHRKFGQWFHGWCDAEQYRRGTGSDDLHGTALCWRAADARLERPRSRRITRSRRRAGSQRQRIHRKPICRTAAIGHDDGSRAPTSQPAEGTKMQMQIELLTVKHLCDRYSVQPITIRRWIASWINSRRRCESVGGKFFGRPPYIAEV